MRMVLVACAVSAAFAQQVEFEVAAVRASKPDQVAEAQGLLPSGRLAMRHWTMRNIIMWAYKIRIEYITEGPNWLDSEHFDVIAKTPAGTSIKDARLMLRALLADRFKLKLREGTRVMPVYALTVAKHGPNLKSAASGTRTICGPSRGVEDQTHIECTNLTLTDLADYLPDLAPDSFDAPAVDSTGLKGTFDFKLDWAPASGPTIFDSLEKQLGLRVEKRKQAMPIIVIIHCERTPTEN